MAAVPLTPLQLNGAEPLRCGHQIVEAADLLRGREPVVPWCRGSRPGAIGVALAPLQQPFEEFDAGIHHANVAHSAAWSCGTALAFSAAISSALNTSKPLRYGSIATIASRAFSVRNSVSIITWLPSRLTFTTVSTTSMNTWRFSSGVASKI